MKKHIILPFLLITLLMSSCVYSLFPIYTEDTLVFKKELLGKWSIDKQGSYIQFESMGTEGSEKADSKKDYKYSIEIKEGFTISSDDPITIEENGKTIYDEDSIRDILSKRMENTEFTTPKAPLPSELKKSLDEEIRKGEVSSKDISYQGSVSVYESKSYKMTLYDADAKGEGVKASKESYIAHLVEIGDDLFMDLYPVKEFNSENISDNFFPVHTFFKVEVSQNVFKMTHFDLEKLNDLFKSNLIRMRHENVDGTILITAQPQELQKFIDRYSDDESVFDYTETYNRL